jgi:hypothetical protein
MRKCHNTANPISKKVHTREYSLWWMRPYSNFSPFQYSKGLVLILVLRLNPDFHNKPAPRKTTTGYSNKTTKKDLVNMVEIDTNGHMDTCKALPMRTFFILVQT